MKKISSVFVIVSVLFSLVLIPETVNSAELRYGDYEYKVVNDAIEIVQYNGNDDIVVVPDTIDGKKVKLLHADCFYGCDIKQITLPETLEYIGESAFENCFKLKKVKLSLSLKEIGRTAFYNTKLTSVYIGENLHKIDIGAFSNINTLKQISVSKSNKHFCSNKKGVLFNKKKTIIIQYPIGDKNSKYIVPKTIKSISEYSFSGSKYLKNIILDSNLKSIKSKAFYLCKKLNKIKTKKNLTSIGSYAFSDCTKLPSIHFHGKLEYIGGYAFCGCKRIKNLSLPKSVINVGDQAFCWTGLKNIKIKANKNLNFGRGVFLGCKISKVKMPVLKSSEGQTFIECYNLKKVIFSRNVKRIYDEDFVYCTKLKSVTIPKNIKKIGKYSLGYNGTYNENYPKIKGFTIKGYKGTAAEKYAKKNGFKFVALKK